MALYVMLVCDREGWTAVRKVYGLYGEAIERLRSLQRLYGQANVRMITEREARDEAPPPAECLALNREYVEARRKDRAANPHLSKDQIVAGEGLL